ncbi:MAG: ABC transporter substrate-binding protein, partial [Actinobacteria bacterium]|nr:ABC transporter substrate-binding protein [Actinomycetota bacterium]
RFRQACAMAIDRKELLTRLSAGKGAIGNPGFLGPKNPYYNREVRQYDLDVAGANSLLDSAGYRMGSGGIRQGPDGKPLSFELRYDSVDGAAMSEIVIPAIKRIGVELRSKPATLGPELFGPKLFGGYDMAVLIYPGPSPGGPNADPEILRVVFRGAPGQFSLTAASNYDNPAFNALADKQSVTFDDAQRKGIVNQMQKIIADDIPILPLYYPERFEVFRKRVLDQWYFTPGEFPTAAHNKQLFVTGMKTGDKIRSTK